MNRIVKVGSKIVGQRQIGLQELYECRVKQKAKRMYEDECHSLARYFDLMPSGRRFRVPKCNTVRFRKTFVPQAISMLNRS